MMTTDQAALYREYVHRHVAIFQDVVTTRIAMDNQYGGITNLPLSMWLPMLVEALGDVGGAINTEDGFDKVRAQLVRVAAVAIAITDWIDRGSPVAAAEQ